MEIEYNTMGEYLLPNPNLRDPPDAPLLKLTGILYNQVRAVTTSEWKESLQESDIEL